MSNDFRQDFLRFALDTGVLRFGEFQTKAGRLSPYFFNAGLFNTGAALARLGRAYAHAIHDAALPFDLLFGPAYKGIPLAAITAAALSEHHGIDVSYAFNRKEVKDHGEGGQIVGAPLAGRILIIDDVISAGTSVRESVEMIRQAGATPAGVVIALDRQERGKGQSTSAIQEVESQFGIPVIAIARLKDLITMLHNEQTLADNLEQVQAYRDQYGA